MAELTAHLQSIYQRFNETPETTNLQAIMGEVCLNLDENSQRRLETELFGWGPLETLLKRNDIFEILITGYDRIFVESPEGLKPFDDCFLSAQSFRNFLDRLCAEAGILVNHKDPFGNGSWKNFRVHVAVPPVVDRPQVTLRRHRTDYLTIDQLEMQNFLTPAQRVILEDWLSERKNFLIVGPTGSGKTTFLNSLINSLPRNERVVTIEDTRELNVVNPLGGSLLAREICPATLTPLSLSDLVKQSLRMRPDRLVVGEVRGPEAKDLLMALATGHAGSMGTLHASSAKQALLRLEMLIQMGAPQWSLSAIRQLIQLSLYGIVVLKAARQSKGIAEICRLGSVESFGVLLERITD